MRTPRSVITADNACVEVVCLPSPYVLARDSKLVDSPQVGFSAAAWSRFLDGAATR